MNKIASLVLIFFWLSSSLFAYEIIEGVAGKVDTALLYSMARVRGNILTQQEKKKKEFITGIWVLAFQSEWMAKRVKEFSS